MLRMIAAGALMAAPATAGDLVFPVDCTLGVDCVIQQYVDRNPGPGVADFTCGPLTYDGHRGTDIRLPDLAAMERGVDVISASEGRVAHVRDGMPDIRLGAARAPDLKGRECGNAVVVQRADGWRFLYCHLKRGSVAVQPGQAVQPGDRLGQVGLSGKTQFPHLHLTVQDQAKRIIDPFDARRQNESCTFKDHRSLWRSLSANSYQPGGSLAAGLTDHVPAYDAVRAGTAAAAELPNAAEAVVFWAHFFGLRTGDRIQLRLKDPAGRTLAADVHTMDRNRATQFRAVGVKGRGAWTQGVYSGTADLIRDGEQIDRVEATVQVR